MIGCGQIGTQDYVEHNHSGVAPVPVSGGG